jgi:hypothetical protein
MTGRLTGRVMSTPWISNGRTERCSQDESMTEGERLAIARDQLVSQRRTLIERYQEAVDAESSDDSIAQLRSVIRAVNNAIDAVAYADRRIRNDDFL